MSTLPTWARDFRDVDVPLSSYFSEYHQTRRIQREGGGTAGPNLVAAVSPRREDVLKSPLQPLHGADLMTRTPSLGKLRGAGVFLILRPGSDDKPPN